MMTEPVTGQGPTYFEFLSQDWLDVIRKWQQNHAVLQTYEALFWMIFWIGSVTTLWILKPISSAGAASRRKRTKSQSLSVRSPARATLGFWFATSMLWNSWKVLRSGKLEAGKWSFCVLEIALFWSACRKGCDVQWLFLNISRARKYRMTTFAITLTNIKLARKPTGGWSHPGERNLAIPGPGSSSWFTNLRDHCISADLSPAQKCGCTSLWIAFAPTLPQLLGQGPFQALVGPQLKVTHVRTTCGLLLNGPISFCVLWA